MGREDHDVRMLGGGRPFVLEVVSPRRRDVELGAIAIGAAVELASPLREVSGEIVTRLKTLDPAKRYRALCRAGSDLDPARVALLEAAFTNVEIQQRTPERVKKARADLVRPRRVLGLSARLVSARELELEVTTEAGTYVKELVSGDQGRTEPSIAAALGVAVAVHELDVLDVLVGDETVCDQANPKP